MILPGQVEVRDQEIPMMAFRNALVSEKVSPVNSHSGIQLPIPRIPQQQLQVVRMGDCLMFTEWLKDLALVVFGCTNTVSTKTTVSTVARSTQCPAPY
jgi:hypothetical protein